MADERSGDTPESFSSNNCTCTTYSTTYYYRKKNKKNTRIIIILIIIRRLIISLILDYDEIKKLILVVLYTAIGAVSYIMNNNG